MTAPGHRSVSRVHKVERRAKGIHAIVRHWSLPVFCFGLSCTPNIAVAQLHLATTLAAAPIAEEARGRAGTVMPVAAQSAPVARGLDDSAYTPWYDDVDTRTKIFLTASALGVATYGVKSWWNTGVSGTFRTRSEGWFGADTPKGGADKAGHAFGAYTGVRAGAHLLELMGNTREDALRLATATSLAVFTGIELVDGFTKSYGFSKEDAIANIVGTGFGWVMHQSPRLDALLDFRLYYRQSPEARAAGIWEPVGGDYNGQKYLLIFKGSGVAALEANPVLRYLEVAVGYGVRGYDPAGAVKGRYLYSGVSLNVARVLDDTVFRSRRESLLRKGTGLFLELFQLPGTVLLADRAL